MKAFPVNSQFEKYQGMDLRDYFAAKAMQGLMQWIADMEFNDGENTPTAISNAAYEYADAMIGARK